MHASRQARRAEQSVDVSGVQLGSCGFILRSMLPSGFIRMEEYFHHSDVFRAVWAKWLELLSQGSRRLASEVSRGLPLPVPQVATRCEQEPNDPSLA